MTQILSRLFSLKKFPLAVFLWAAFLIFTVVLNRHFILLRQEERKTLAAIPTEELQDSSRRWNAPLVRLLAGHHVSFVTDLLLMRFLGDRELSHLREGQRSKLGMDLLLASDLDPRFYDLHQAGAVLLSVIRDDRFSAVELLERANRFRVQELPKYSTEFREDFWANAIQGLITLVYVHQFDFGDLDAARAAVATLRPEEDAPEYLKLLKERYQNPKLIFELGFRVYEKTLSFDREQSVKDHLRVKLGRLQLNYFYFQLYEKSKHGEKSQGVDPLGNPVQWSQDGIPWSDRLTFSPMKFWSQT